MRIGIDGSVFIDKQFTGVTKSVYEIIRHWTRKYPEHEYFIICRLPIKVDLDLPDNWHVVYTTDGHDSFFERGYIGKIKNIIWSPVIIRKLDLDVYWGTNYMLPMFTQKKVRYYVTIYDLSLFIYEGIGQKDNLLKLKLFARKACKTAEKVIAISSATAKDIKKVFNIDENKIVVSYCGSPETAKPYDISEVNDKLLFEKDFFLFISTIEPRKNVNTIIKAFEEYSDKTGYDKKLIIAGKRGWNCDSVFEAIDQSRYKDRIILPGYISDDDKSYLLSKAEAFLYPSLYEGFGIPILEAFRYKLPVITSNVSSMPEVGGDAAFYIDDVYDYRELAQQMIRVDNITDRKDLEIRMQKQLDKFSWEKNAEEMMKIISGKGV